MTVQSNCTHSYMTVHVLSLYAFMHAGKCTCTSRSAIKGSGVHRDEHVTRTHAHLEWLTFHLRFVLSQTPLLPPQLSMRGHHLWLPPPWTLIPLEASQSPLTNPFSLSACSGSAVCDLSPWPLWPLLLYSCVQDISISVDGLRLRGISVVLIGPLGFWYEYWSIGEVAWKIKGREEVDMNDNKRGFLETRMKKMRVPDKEDKWGQGDKTERDSDTREGRFNRRDSGDGGAEDQDGQ